jgi:23S rRNA pseudouridine2605 synthase
MSESEREPEGERLQKILSRAGVASRRSAEELIKAGRVAVDGRIIRELGARARPDQKVTVDGRPISPGSPKTYIIYYKPRGVVSTAVDTHGRPTVVEAVEADLRVYPVGRLDMDSEGLVVLTNDGELAHRMTHPSFGLDKTYRVLVQGTVSPQELKHLRQGVEVEGKMTAPAEVTVVGEENGDTWLEFTLHEGRKRQIRHMSEAVGHSVLRLTRLRIGPLTLGTLKPGQSRLLRPEEIKAVKRAVELEG